MGLKEIARCTVADFFFLNDGFPFLKINNFLIKKLFDISMSELESRPFHSLTFPP